MERFLGWTSDIFPGPAGGAFINNNPGASIVGAIPLLIARPVLSRIERWNDALPSSVIRSRDPTQYPATAAVKARREWYFMAVGFVTVAGLMAPVSALMVTAFGWTLWSGGAPSRLAVAAALLFGFGTPIFMRTGYLNHNLLVCHAGLLAALLLWNGGSKELPVKRLIPAGALGGFAVLCDYSGVLVLGAAGTYAWLRAADSEANWGRRLRVGAWYGVGALPLLLTLVVYQRWAFGHSALPSQQYMPAIEQTSRGYRGLDWPSFDLAMMNFFDPRFGLFAVCPVLVLGLAAPFVRKPGTFRLPNRELWTALAFFGGFTLFCAANQYSSLQWNTGIRYLVPTIPWMLLLGLQVLQIFPSAVRSTLIGASILMSWVPALTQESWPALVSGKATFELSWVHRMAEYGGIAYPAIVTATVLGATATAITWIWRRELRDLRLFAPQRR